MPRLDELFKLLKARSGSDLHLAAGLEPRLRVHGALEAAGDEWPELSHAELVGLMRELVSEDAWREYEEQLRSLGASPAASAFTLIWDTRFSIVTIVLAGFGRAAVGST